MIDFRSGREPKNASFDFISIRIASPECPTGCAVSSESAVRSSGVR